MISLEKTGEEYFHLTSGEMFSDGQVPQAPLEIALREERPGLFE